MERTRAALGRACLDTVFLHNPERTGDPAVLPIVLREAFAVREEAATAGHLSTYGIATWSGFTEGLTTVEELDRLATEAAGSPDHRLRVGQLPVSLVEADVLELALDSRGPIGEAAEHGWQVFVSAPCTAVSSCGQRLTILPRCCGRGCPSHRPACWQPPHVQE
ncbi:aldo-keto reductase family protein [Streptomyces lydicus]|uniref:hypothetical protein n=1 Tax=Streptomyces lydicus TaxID=47763 RepID=UPI0037014888